MEYEISPREKLNLGLKELWSYRELFYFFTWRDVKVKYKQTALGVAWAVLQPLLMMALITLFFGQALKKGGVETDVPYPLFVYSGLLMWNIFSSGMSASANSMVTNANIIKKIYFPRLIIPMSSVLVSLFDFLMALLIFAGMLVYYHNEVNISISRMLIGIPCSIIITIFGTFGPGCLLAALNVKYRDFRYIIPFLIQVLLFLTPVIYPVTMLGHEWQRWLVAMNPVSGAIDLFRWTFTGSPLHLHLLAISAASGVLFFIAGLFYFRKTEAYFADLA